MGWLVLVCGLAFFLSWNLGANDVSNAMGTSVGAKVITLRQAILLAGVLELAGAIFLGQEVTATLTGKVAHLQVFEGHPHLFTLSAVAELLTTGLWLSCATAKGWPVASSHAVVGAIAGVNLMVCGLSALDLSALGAIALAWLLTPLLSGLISVGCLAILQRCVLSQADPLDCWKNWTPWLSTAVVGVVGGLALPAVANAVSIFLSQHWGWTAPPHDYGLGLGLLGILGLTHWTLQEPRVGLVSDRTVIERQLGKFQIVSACCMAFAHGSNDVGHAVAPLANYFRFWQTQTIPVTSLPIPLWILGLGAVGIVGGLATWGKKVITTVGENFISLQPSDGFCAELGAATVVLLASRWGLPISTTHALVGSVVGIGLMQGAGALKWSTVRQVAAAWMVTVPISMMLGATIFMGLRSLFPD